MIWSHFSQKPVQDAPVFKLVRDHYGHIFANLEHKDVAASRLVCRRWSAYLSDADFRAEKKIKGTDNAFCLFLLAKIPGYLEMRHDLNSRITRRCLKNITLQPEWIGFAGIAGVASFCWNGFRKNIADLNAPSLLEQKVKLAYFIGENASDARVISYLRGESIAIGIIMLGFPALSLIGGALALTGSLIKKYEEDDFHKQVIKEAKASLLYPAEYSNVDALKPYIDGITQRVMRVPVCKLSSPDCVYDLLHFVDPISLRRRFPWIDLSRVVFRKDVYDRIQSEIEKLK